MKSLPVSNSLPIHNLSSVFKHTTNTYKFYWFLAILDYIRETKNARASIYSLISRMIAKAWYPVNYYRLFYGKQDKLSDLVIKIKLNSFLSENDKENLIINEIQELKNSSDYSYIVKDIIMLGRYVPYRFLRPWFKQELRGMKDSEVTKFLKKYSEVGINNNTELCVYKIVHSSDPYIEIFQIWKYYLLTHNKILTDYCYWHLINHLQKKNPYVPNLSDKLSFPGNRNLKNARNFWEIIFQDTDNFRCIYSGKALNNTNYSLDHFIPWKLVTHDLLWNIIPTFKSINSSKSDSIPSLELYFDRFAEIQNQAFRIVLNKRKENLLEDYVNLFRKEISSIEKLPHNEFSDFLRSNIEPLVQIGKNMGFETNWKYSL
jgi:hypothetical protein